MTRRAPVALAVLLALGLAAGLATARADEPPPATLTTTVTETVTSAYEGHGALWWAGRARGWHKRARYWRKRALAVEHRAGTSNAGRLALISRNVFGARWRTAACIAHYESTDGAHLYNGPNLGPWQVNVYWHPWVNAQRVVSDWWYSARVAYRISSGGRDWSAWATAARCGA